MLFRVDSAGKSIKYLNRLARALTQEGWVARTRYQQRPPLLHVFDARVPLVGESIMAAPAPFGWCYWSSLGLVLADCPDVELAVMQIDHMLGPVVSAMLGEDTRPIWPMLGLEEQ